MKKESRQKCFVDGCNNHTDQGSFVGKVCFPCFELATHINEGNFTKKFYINRKAARFIIDNYKEILKQAGVKDTDTPWEGKLK